MKGADGLFDLCRRFKTYGEVFYQIGIHLFRIGGRLLLGADAEDTEFTQVNMVAIEHKERDGFTYCKRTGKEG